MEFKRSIVWFRRDLRFFDNVSLSEACKHSELIIPVFIFDSNILSKLSDKGDKRVTFIYDSLLEMENELLAHGKSLVIRIGDPIREIPMLARELKVDCVFTNRDYENYAILRDKNVCKHLHDCNIKFLSYKDQVIFEGKEILNQAGKPYQVFTPYKNAWLKLAKEKDFTYHNFSFSKFIGKDSIKSNLVDWNIKNIGFIRSSLYIKAGRNAALHSLKNFADKIKYYEENRDCFALNSTSKFSVHLRFGTLSIREAFKFAREYSFKSALVWQNELIWREFFKMILSEFSHVELLPFKKDCQDIKWENNESYFNKWCEGQTGFPIVDAAMRLLNKTGWMHNRLRMIVASFLTKDLLIDYRKGEDYFAKKLLDFDLSSNNGGWQWCASTGCDAQPYFRVFNPESQSKKFDPQGMFIKEQCPELSQFPAKYIHSPEKSGQQQQLKSNCKIGKDYPFPIVEHDKQRLKAISLFKK